MKSLFLSVALIVGVATQNFAQETKKFNVEKFEKALISQMEIIFPGMTLDTTLRFATSSISQAEAGYPECYGTKKGGMVNTENDETEEAIRLVVAYRKYIEEVLYFNEKALKRCRFTEFCATAVEQYGGLVRYGFVIDNNITLESLINSK